MGYLKQPQFNGDILRYSGGVGRAVGALGDSFSNVADGINAKKKELKDEALKQKIYQDSRTDRKDDVEFRNNNAKQEQQKFDTSMNFNKDESKRQQDNFNSEMNFKKDESKQQQNNFNAKFNLQKDAITKEETKTNEANTSKAKAMREYLGSYGIDTKNYSDKDMIYAGDIIEKTHTDKSDYKFNQIVYKDKEPYAMYKNAKGETKIESLFGGANGENGSNQRDINEAKAQKKYEEYQKAKYGQTSTLKID